jgi:formylmethanofuran dehydrogenase subunit E
MRTSSSAPQVALVGRSGSGKTTLIERVVSLMTEQGLKLAVVKHTHHLAEMDRDGKDSWRFGRAGAGIVVLTSPGWTHLRAAHGLVAPESVDSFLAKADLVIHEGGRSSPHPKVLIGETEAEARERGTEGRILATIGTSSGSLPSFSRDDAAGVAALLSSIAVCRRPSFETLLERSVAHHGHLCPGQVLGVRMTVRGLEELGLPIQGSRKRLFIIAETDRCAIDAIASVSGCSVGKRSLRVIDHGKMAACFVDTVSGEAVRVAARDDARDLVTLYAEEGFEGHEAQASAYQKMPDAELLAVQRVRVTLPESEYPGRKRGRAACEQCGEHVADGREVTDAGRRLCRACAGDSYFTLLD